MNKEIDIIQVDGYLIGVDENHSSEWITNGRDVFKPSDMPEYSQEYRERYWQDVVTHSAGHPTLKDSGLPLLPEVEEGVEKEYQKAWKVHSFDCGFATSAYYFGLDMFKAASKRFTEADVRKAFEAGRSYVAFSGAHGIDWEWEDSEQYLQSIKPSPKKFVMEMRHVCKQAGCSHSDFNEPKTIIRDGKTYLVGTYKF